MNVVDEFTRVNRMAATRLIVSSTAALIACVSGAAAQSYPAKPIRVVVPFAAGGGADIIARIVAPRMTEQLGQQVVVENRPGAATIVGAEAVARAPGDGYTLLMAVTATLAINPALFNKLPYDPIRDFTPVALTAIGPNVLVAHPSLPVRNVKQLIALAKSQPDRLTYGSSGMGGSSHLAGELFNTMAGVKIVHVPYKGAAPATVDLLAGQIDLTFVGLGAALPFVKSGRLRALAVGSAKRSIMVPELPTVAETLDGFEAVAWFGLLGPAALPRDVVQKLNGIVGAIVGRRDIADLLVAQGYEPLTSTPEAFAGYVRSELGKWSRVVKDAGVKPE